MDTTENRGRRPACPTPFAASYRLMVLSIPAPLLRLEPFRMLDNDGAEVGIVLPFAPGVLFRILLAARRVVQDKVSMHNERTLALALISRALEADAASRYQRDLEPMTWRSDTPEETYAEQASPSDELEAESHREEEDEDDDYHQLSVISMEFEDGSASEEDEDGYYDHYLISESAYDRECEEERQRSLISCDSDSASSPDWDSGSALLSDTALASILDSGSSSPTMQDRFPAPCEPPRSVLEGTPSLARLKAAARAIPVIAASSSSFSTWSDETAPRPVSSVPPESAWFAPPYRTQKTAPYSAPAGSAATAVPFTTAPPPLPHGCPLPPPAGYYDWTYAYPPYTVSPPMVRAPVCTTPATHASWPKCGLCGVSGAHFTCIKPQPNSPRALPPTPTEAFAAEVLKNTLPPKTERTRDRGSAIPSASTYRSGNHTTLAAAAAAIAAITATPPTPAAIATALASAWTCGTCQLRNHSTETERCLLCEAPRCKRRATVPEIVPALPSGFSVGGASNSALAPPACAFTFPSGTWACRTGLLRNPHTVMDKYIMCEAPKAKHQRSATPATGAPVPASLPLPPPPMAQQLHPEPESQPEPAAQGGDWVESYQRAMLEAEFMITRLERGTNPHQYQRPQRQPAPRLPPVLISVPSPDVAGSAASLSRQSDM